LSRVVQMILEAEMHSEKDLGMLVEQALRPGMTRYQFLDALLELRSALARWPGLAHHVEDQGCECRDEFMDLVIDPPQYSEGRNNDPRRVGAREHLAPQNRRYP
jgi:hypothetical protein